MLNSQPGEGTIRKVWPGEYREFGAHLLRLDANSRRLRFGGATSDTFVRDYCDTAYRLKSLIYGYFVDGTMRGAAELRPVMDNWPVEAEAAFSVEEPHQDIGIGTELMDRVLLAAQNRGVSTLYMICLRENSRMQSIARKYSAQLHFDRGEVAADLDPSWPTYFSLLREGLEDGKGFVTAILERNA